MKPYCETKNLHFLEQKWNSNETKILKPLSVHRRKPGSKGERNVDVAKLQCHLYENYILKPMLDGEFNCLNASLKDPFGYNLFLLKLKIENWKYCSKIIFKCVNSTVRLIFNIFKCIYSTATVCEQYYSIREQ